SPGEIEALTLIQIPRIAHLARDTIEDPILANGIEHGRIAVDPDGVVVVPHRVQPTVGAPRPAHRLRILQHLAQPYHTRRAPVSTDVFELTDELPCAAD